MKPANAPKKLGRYVIREKLGEGSFGVVYLAEHEELKTPCAVKVLSGEGGLSEDALKRFRREATAVAKMGKHPNIVTVYDLGRDEKLGVTYFAMELVKGRSLKETLREHPYTPKEAAALVEKVARAVHHAHKHGVLHRDLKPDNVMVRESDQEPLVVDFGLAREVGTEAGKSTAGAGTPSYMAPEQARRQDEQIDARTDVYGVGGILYETLIGLPPHPGQDLGQVMYHILRGEVLPPRRVRQDIPKDLETICLKCLDASPPRRYASAEALAEDLARFLRGDPVTARPVGRFGRAVRRMRKHPLVSSLIAASVVLALGMGWRFLGPARIDIATEPSSAQVEAVGATLWRRRWVWPAGDFRLKVSADGYEPREVQLHVAPGSVGAREAVKLDLDHGFLQVDSTPPGASVYIDEKDTGAVTPVPALEVRNGAHTLALRLPDHDAHSTTVQVASGKTLPLGVVPLQHEQGWLALDGTPRGMTVIVWDPAAKNEVTRLSPPVEVPLPTGTYVLQGRLKDHFDRDSAIDVRRGDKAHPTHAKVWLNRQVLPWSYQTGGRIGSRPALGDVNGDGVLDCVVVSDDEVGFLVRSDHARVYALSGKDASVLWTHETDGAGGWSSPALGDLNGDGCLDSVVGSMDERVYALSGMDGAVLWACKTGGPVSSSPALGDLNGDSVLDCVVVSDDGKVYALSGRDGAVLWAHKMGDKVWWDPALGDLNRDGVLDCVGISDDGKVYALSGRDGAVLWACETGDAVWSSPALGDVNGDGVVDCVVGSCDCKVYGLSGRDGSVLWAYETGCRVEPSWALGDLNGDGCLDCVVGSCDHRVYAILGGRDVEKVADLVTRLRYLRHGRWWPFLRDFATKRLPLEKASWAGATTWMYLGIARSWLGQPNDALDAFAEARKLHLRAPDAAVYEWIASRLWKECSPERRKEADSVLLDALGFEPDVVFDTFVEAKDLLPAEAKGPLRELLHGAQAKAPIEAPLLLSVFVPDAVSKDTLAASNQQVLAKLDAAEGSPARWHGYLALLAHAQGDDARFRRTYATYLDQPRRPESLDTLLAEIASKKGK